METSHGKGLKLTTRLNLFFLATLALVLVGFSTALYHLASVHLHQQAEERLEASLNTVVAAVEVKPDGLEWEPEKRHSSLGPAALDSQVVWLVSDDQGKIVDRSKQAGAEDVFAEASQILHSSQRSTKRLNWHGEHWQCSQQWLYPAPPATTKIANSPPSRKKDKLKYRALSISVGVSLEPIRDMLHRLTTVLVGLSLGVWLLALFVGRTVCRRALLPVSRMAVSAREMNVSDLDRRLPTVTTGDELEDLSRAFNSLLDRLQESFERQRRFTGDASHQFRTPLAVILGQIEVALRRERPAEEYQRVLTTVHRRVEHLRRIVESLLFLARADAETRLTELERVNLNEWLAGHLKTWSEHERAKDIVLECDSAGSCVEVQPALLGELINTVIDNACKYSTPGTPIAVRLRNDEQSACVQVEDRGCGIAEADFSHLFTPFFRSAETRRRGIVGVGLGLSIARRLAEAFGGTAAVTSRVGHGSCFILRLPLVVPAKDELVA